MPTLEEALFIWKRQPRIVRLRHRKKEPAEKWDASPKPFAYVKKHWGARQSKPFNIGIVCGEEFIVVDADSKDVARELYRRLPRTEMMTKTANGGHLYFRAKCLLSPKVNASVMGVKADIRAGKSYLVAPGSIHPTGQRYEKVGSWDLTKVPYFDPNWLTTPGRAKSIDIARQQITNVPTYLSKVESIQGQNGSAGLVRAVAICRDNGYSEAETLALLLDWNQLPVVQPAWSRHELVRAVARVFAQGRTS